MANTRMCVICRTKTDKANLYRFIVLGQEIVLDINHRLCTYGHYVCKDNSACNALLYKWIKKYDRKKRKNSNTFTDSSKS